MTCYEGREKCMNILKEIATYRSALTNQLTSASSTFADSLNKKDQLAAALENTPQGNTDASFAKLNGNFAALQGNLQRADVVPTIQVTHAVKEAQKQLDNLIKKWNDLKNK